MDTAEATSKVLVHFVEKFERQGHYVRPVVNKNGWRLEIGTRQYSVEIDVDIRFNLLKITWTQFNALGNTVSIFTDYSDLRYVDLHWLWTQLTDDLMDVTKDQAEPFRREFELNQISNREGCFIEIPF